MKVVKRLVVGILCAVILICGNRPVVSMAKDSAIMPCYEETNKAYALMSFSNNVASCKIIVTGTSDTAKITGTAWLYDVTTNDTVDSWSIAASSDSMSYEEAERIISEK